MFGFYKFFEECKRIKENQYFSILYLESFYFNIPIFAKKKDFAFSLNFFTTLAWVVMAPSYHHKHFHHPIHYLVIFIYIIVGEKNTHKLIVVEA